MTPPPPKALLAALTGHTPPRTPIWLMRQAGRCLPEYRQIRKSMSTYQMFQRPDVAAEISLQPLKRFDYDGCIVYADILHIADALGAGLSFVRGSGPKMSRLIRSAADLDFVRKARAQPETMAPLYECVYETLDRVKSQLASHVTLIGFAGSPWSVATYMIEGQSPQLSFNTKRLMAESPQVFTELMTHITALTKVYLHGQIRAGAEVIQLFESHAGMALSRTQYSQMCLPYILDIVTSLRTSSPHIPVIYYMNGSAGKLDLLQPLLPLIQGFGVDHRQTLAHAARALTTAPQTSQLTLQGNLDPMDLYAHPTKLATEVADLLAAGSAHPGGFIFNTGHGLTPHTPLASLEALVHQVHAYPVR